MAAVWPSQCADHLSTPFFLALHSFYLEDPESKTGGTVVSDKGCVGFVDFGRLSLLALNPFLHSYSDAPDEWKKPLAPLKAAFILTDPTDPRHRAHARFRERLGQFVLKATHYLRDQGGDDSIDAVTGIVGMLSTYRAFPLKPHFPSEASDD